MDNTWKTKHNRWSIKCVMEEIRARKKEEREIAVPSHPASHARNVHSFLSIHKRERIS